MSQVQSVIFDNTRWTIKRAIEWLKAHGFVFKKVDIKPRTYRFRQLDPNKFNKYRIKQTADGISLVIGFN